MNAARDPSRLADAVADLKDPEMIKSAREMMAQAEPAFQVEMQRMMEQPGGSLIAFAPHRTRCE